MNARTGLDRAAIALGLASLASLVFLPLDGDLEFVTMGVGGVIVAVVLGLLAVAAGALSNRPLTLVAGAGFLLAAGLLLVLLGSRGNGGFLQGSASTFALWLGLGIGLAVLGTTSRDHLQ